MADVMTVREAFRLASDEVQTCSTLARDPAFAPSSLAPRSEAEALAEALEAITRDDCMITNGETGSWIDTEAPARIAEAALDAYRAHHPKETP